ncbi:MAG: hypothetical protein ACODAU_12495 [Myxococcota bacterium]
MHEQDNEIHREVPSGGRRVYEAPAVVESSPLETLVLAETFSCLEGCSTDEDGNPC